MQASENRSLVPLAALVCFFFLLPHGCTPSSQPFDQAIQQAKESRLTEVSVPAQGVPFYLENTLDPTWSHGGRPIVRVPKLSLFDQDGLARDESLFDGKTTFVAFFFTSCAGFCPTFLNHLKQVESRLKGVPGMQYVAISIDPTTDNPAKLKSYFKRMKFNAKTWTLLTGDEAQILRLARETFSSEAFKLPKSKGQFSHSEHFFVIDPERRLRGALKGTRLDVANRAQELMTQLKTVP